MPTASRSVARKASGFSFTEMLAAIAAVAIAVIGIAAVYLDSSHTSQDSEAHAKAVELAETMAGHIRRYRGQDAGFASSIGVVCDRSKTTLSQTNPADSRDATANDAACWQHDVEADLPNGLGTITLDSASNAYTVIVSWYEPGVGAASYVLKVS
jgi:type IV pilus modification protein PilV